MSVCTCVCTSLCMCVICICVYVCVVSVHVCECLCMWVNACRYDCKYMEERGKPWVLVSQTLFAFLFSFLFHLFFSLCTFSFLFLFSQEVSLVLHSLSRSVCLTSKPQGPTTLVWSLKTYTTMLSFFFNFNSGTKLRS